MVARRILLVGLDPALCQALADQLRWASGFETGQAATAAAALALLQDQRFDAVLMESLCTDHGDAATWCRTLRGAGVACPVLLLAEPDNPPLAVSQLPAAVEIVAKPFRLGGLLNRLLALVLRAEREADSGGLVIGPYRLRPEARQLRDLESGRTVRLTEKEVALLSYLHQAGPAAVSREVLLGAVWGYRAGLTTHTVETHIYRLRRKIEPDPKNASILLTEPGGYRLSA